MDGCHSGHVTLVLGAFAIGLIIITRMLIIPVMHDLWGAATPTTITLWTYPGVDDETISPILIVLGSKGFHLL